MAKKLREKLNKIEGGAVSKEMQELQSVMVDIGMDNTPVTKEAAGKEYYSKLAQQLSTFVKV